MYGIVDGATAVGKPKPGAPPSAISPLPGQQWLPGFDASMPSSLETASSSPTATIIQLDNKPASFGNPTSTPPQPSSVNSLPGLLRHHLAELRRSGLRDGIIQSAGIYSEIDVNKLAAILNRKARFINRSHLAPAIIFPFVGADGRNGYCRIKPDTPRLDAYKKPIKYESPVDHPNEPYLPPGVAEILSDATRELLITEGEKKALAATQAGFPCIGLVGVYGWKGRGRESLLASLENVVWQGRTVYIVFDSDLAENESVQDAESRLAAQLTNRGAKVRVVRLPHGPAGDDGKPTKVGLDDFLVAHDIGELRKLLDNAEEPRKLTAAETKLDARNLDAAETGKRFLGGTVIDGVPRLRFWRGMFHLWRQGAYRELDNAEVRSELITCLNQSYFRLTTAATNNVLDQVKAQSILSFKIEPPVWITKEPGSWPGDEILVCRNGLVHLPSLVAGSTEYMRPPTPTFFTTSALDCDFQLNVPAPSTWLQFLSQLWPNDSASIGTLQEWFGYCLRQDTRLQKILLLIGPKRSGKGTIARVLRALIGNDNVCGPTLASLATQFGLWPFLGKSLAIISDARLSGHTDSAIVVERLLSISGEDAMTIDRKNLPLVTCKLSTRLMILSNELPRVSDTSGALAGRMIVLRLTESFFGREDETLTDKLLAELPGILLWAIEGWHRLWQRRRFTQPISAEELVTAMSDLASPVGAFVQEYCIVGPGKQVAVDDIYAAWKDWCQANGRREAGTAQSFGRDLHAVAPSLKKTQPREGYDRYRAYEGIGLRVD